MNVSDFFRLAFQSGAKYDTDKSKFQMGPAEAHNFTMFAEQEREMERDQDDRIQRLMRDDRFNNDL
jgi:hypothetical protein